MRIYDSHIIRRSKFRNSGIRGPQLDYTGYKHVELVLNKISRHLKKIDNVQEKHYTVINIYCSILQLSRYPTWDKTFQTQLFCWGSKLNNRKLLVK